MRSHAEFAEFALNNVTIGGNAVSVTKYFPQSDPQFFSNPAYQRLGQYIGQDHLVFSPATFQPWPGGGGQQPSGGGGARSGRRSAAAGTAGPAPASSGVAAAAAGGGGDLISAHTVAWAGGDAEEECPICLVEQDATSLSLAGCGHTYHRACLEALLRSSARTYIECPKCKRVYGERRGNMPTSGTISHTLSPAQLPGHQGAGSIEITFNFRPGVQGPEHPAPGQPYHAHNFPRRAWLPDTREGLMALHGIYLAWDQRIMFTVGTSLTTGMQNTITWNDIHMKTQPSGGQHGYPDPNYLSNLRDDLSVRGITEAAISEHMARHPQLRTRGHM